MSDHPATRRGRGPFRAEQIRPGDPYELSNGHPIECFPAGGRGSRANLVGAGALDTDPAVESAGVDTGFSPDPSTLRAPDVAVGNVANEPGWVAGTPRLAVEYADTGQNERELGKRIAELLGAGTEVVWVVRLVGPRRVEVHEVGRPVRVVVPGEELLAPGILRNPVAVETLYDREAAHEAMLRNLLQRRGYESFEAVRLEGETKGRAEGEAKGRAEERAEVILDLLTTRGMPVPEEVRSRVLACRDISMLRRWFVRAITASSAEQILHEP